MIRGLHSNIKGMAGMVEIILIVAILGILASLSIAYFGDSAEKAKIRAAASALNTVRQAMEVYRVDSLGEYPPTAAIKNFEDLYNLLVNYGLTTKLDGNPATPDTNPANVSSNDFYAFGSYTINGNDYTFTLIARGRDRVPLTANSERIYAERGGRDYSRLCN